MSDKIKFATKVIHAGQTPDPQTGSIMPAIHPSTTFAQHSPGEPYGKFEYSRTDNPTRKILEQHLAALENARFASCFSSGCAALSTLLTIFKSGDHIILGDDVYGGTFRIFDKIFKKFNLDFSVVDATKIENIEKEVNSKTKLIWLETPTNPMLKILDIKAISTSVKALDSSILIAIDNTFATPALQNPITLGADIVAHSCTKYLGGHSDVLGGVLITDNNSIHESIRFVQNSIGAVPSPFDCYLLLRSTKTLSIRMKAHCENATIIANFLDKHSKIETVYFPGLKTHPEHEIAKSQMNDFGGMISFTLKTDLPGSKTFLSQLKIFRLAESLGGVESLIEHPAIMTHAAIPESQRELLGIKDSLIRASIGSEHCDDLIADLTQALGYI